MNPAPALLQHQPFHERDALPLRAPLRWPDGLPLALAVVVSAEYCEMQPPAGAFLPPNVPGGFGRGPYPDVRAWSMREYGSRVGVFRLIDVLARHAVRATLAIDAHSALHRPPIARECLRHGWEIAAHGWAATQVISSQMSDAQERDHVRTAIEAVERGTGVRPTGWHGPEYGESVLTPALLAEHGIDHVLDWPNDEQPVMMNTAGGELVSIPMTADLDDVFAQWHRKLTTKRWMQAVIEAVDVLADDGRSTGRLLVLNLHPWLSGQPHRATYVDELLRALKLRDDIWWATTQGISTWFRRTRHAPGV